MFLASTEPLNAIDHQPDVPGPSEGEESTSQDNSPPQVASSAPIPDDGEENTAQDNSPPQVASSAPVPDDGEDIASGTPNGDDPNGDDPNGDDPNGDDPNGDDHRRSSSHEDDDMHHYDYDEDDLEDFLLLHGYRYIAGFAIDEDNNFLTPEDVFDRAFSF
jgi:hypothetical protein